MITMRYAFEVAMCVWCVWCVWCVAAVQNERQPRNTATIRPEALLEMDQERALREAAVAVGVFGCVFFVNLHYKFVLVIDFLNLLVRL
jgi:hypothetical protein